MCTSIYIPPTSSRRTLCDLFGFPCKTGLVSTPSASDHRGLVSLRAALSLALGTVPSIGSVGIVRKCINATDGKADGDGDMETAFGDGPDEGDDDGGLGAGVPDGEENVGFGVAYDVHGGRR